MNKEQLLQKMLTVFESERFARFYSDAGLLGRYTSGDLEHEEQISREEAKSRVLKEINRLFFS